MKIAPEFSEQVARAKNDLRMGMPVVLRGGESVVATALETASPERLREFVEFGEPLAIALTERRANTLKARAYDGDIARIRVPRGASPEWFYSVADPSLDLQNPMKGPFLSERGGDASVYRAAVELARRSRLLPAVLILKVSDPTGFASAHGLLCLELPNMRSLARLSSVRQVVNARLPLEGADSSRIRIFRPNEGSEEHGVLEFGEPRRSEPVLARIHSACFTGDVLGSLKCDCGQQLRAALAKIRDEKKGVLLYLNQEGRGIGLSNKIRAYSLQDQGFDTVDANHRLGFEDDERDFRLGSEILRQLGFSSVRLMTNNPAKAAMMKEFGIKVAEMIPIKAPANPFNAEYLATKARKSGHVF
ncbi:MAG: GTP cyclohydrolase II [Albidovulum sp.]|nr:GTP cyclohydrolase II [Albidovulum sp.]MDE0308037.1 GTP cyclohydrolase II [Albidovulum sp.]MDE0533258.1 GTP cyclohydrolase II [Albidovulum sp.]